MTPEEITELAKQAGFKPDCPTVRLAFSGFDIKQFATLVRSTTLEEAASLCERVWPGEDRSGHEWTDGFADGKGKE